MTRAALHWIYKRNPVLWCRDVLGFIADKKQEAFLNSDADDLLIVWSRQTGKTQTASGLVSHYSIHNDETLTVCTSATLRQANILTGRIQADVLRATGELRRWERGKEFEIEEEDIYGNVRIVRMAVMSMTLSNRSEIVAIPPSPDSARGYSPNLLICDESARTRDTLFHALSPMRAARRVRFIAMTTAASMQGWFFNLWQNDPDVQKIEYLAKDCERITPEFLAKEKRRLPMRIYKAEYENVWYPKEGAVLDQATIRDLFDHSVKPMFESPLSGKQGNLISQDVRAVS